MPVKESTSKTFPMFPPATAYLTASLRSPKALNVTTLEPMLESSSMLTSGGVEPSSKVGTTSSSAR